MVEWVGHCGQMFSRQVQVDRGVFDFGVAQQNLNGSQIGAGLQQASRETVTNDVSRDMSRDTGHLRDDRLFIVACDDTFAPKQYFDFFRIPRIQIHVVETLDGSSAAGHVLDRLLALELEHEEDDERWLLLDVDHYGTGHHLQSLTTAIAEARRHGVNIVLNKPCFELWLLLHHVDESTVTTLATAGDVERSLRSVLGQYNKTRSSQCPKPAHVRSDSTTP